jgi:hypothetical protein
MKLPKFFYQFSYQRDGLWILFFSVAPPLIVLLFLQIISYLAR